MKDCAYYIGLDIGTNSVGWAVTDTEYNLLKTNGKTMWGSHLFDAGKTAEERRAHRTARRRADRAKERVALLNELFAEEIAKVDPDFLLRLQESKFFEEDKKVAGRFSIFNDPDYTDANYHEEYPTIYHLRSDLIHHPEKQFDIRLVYLAVAHIIKKRGHFLFEGREFSDVTSFQVVFEELLQALSDYCDFDTTTVMDTAAIEELLKDKTKTVTDKKRELASLFFVEKGSRLKYVCDLLAGGQAELSNLFGDESLKESEVNKISFGSGYEDKVDALDSLLEDRFFLIEKMKAVYDWAVLTDILKNFSYVSDAKVDSYEKHKKDLKLTKEVVRKYCSDDVYKKIFSENKNKSISNYVAYTGHVSGTNKYAEKYCCSQEDFCKFVSKEIGAVEPETEEERYILSELQFNTAMPKQVTKENSVIPYQLNQMELEKILENTAKYYPFLLEEEDGVSVKEKVEKLLTFRIPYYVGPLNKNNSKNAWIVRKEPGKIYPWNFEEKVDKTASASKFIERMTNQCTYLVGETVLPKDSILYSKYVIYNQLNNIRLDGEKLEVEVKNKLFQDCYLNVQKPKQYSNKALLKYLQQQGKANKDSEIAGLDTGAVGTMKAYVQFRKLLGQLDTAKLKMAEDIIYKITILGESKDLLKEYLQKEYGAVLSENQIKEICRWRYTGWGRFSEAFLTQIYDFDPSTGECTRNIISGLEETQDNLMQLLGSSYGYAQLIEEFNAEKNDLNGTITYEDIEKLYVSPAVKRSIWRTALIVKEIVKIAGHNPDKIFVEMARDADGSKKGQRTQSRKAKLEACYKAARSDCEQLAEQLGKYDENQLRSDKLFLYFTQMGRCMYSGEAIDLDNLLSANSNYDIDHIYPQSKTKDDSLDNRVLVKRKLNEEKTDKYPLPNSFRTDKTKALWDRLQKANLISKEKYNRLKRTEGFSDDELAGFISRQIVETRQSTKAIANLLDKAYDGTSIVYVKAGNVSSFRQQFDIVKCRSINDYHHAKDAYLNIVVGNVYDTKFTSNPRNFISNKDNRYSLNRIYDFDVKRGNTVAWTTGENGSITTVKKNVMKNNVLFTRYATEQKGGFFKQNPVAHGRGQMPLKTSDDRLADFSKYGGYNEVAGAYFALVRHEKKGKPVKTFEAIPIYLKSRVEGNTAALAEYFATRTENPLTNPEILLPKVKFNALLEVDGFRMHISGRSGANILMKCAEQLLVPEEIYCYFKKIDKFVARSKVERNAKISPLQKITKEENLAVYDCFLDKLENSKYNKKLSSQIATFKNGRERFVELSLEDQCRFLANAVVLFQCVPGDTDLSLIGGASRAGQYKMGSNITKQENIKLINQSITGIFENVVDLAAL